MSIFGSLIGSIGDLITGNQSKQAGKNLANAANTAYAFNQYRPEFSKMLEDFMKNPSEMVTKMPGYQFGLDQAETATMRQGASQGLLGSGAMAQAVSNTGANYAKTMYDDLFQQLAMLSGASANPSGQFGGLEAGLQMKVGGQGQMVGAVSQGANTVGNATPSGSSDPFSGILSGGGGGSGSLFDSLLAALGG